MAIPFATLPLRRLTDMSLVAKSVPLIPIDPEAHLTRPISRLSEVELHLSRLVTSITDPTLLAHLNSCLKFLLYGKRGSFSGYRMDVLNGTRVQCKTGLKLWLVHNGLWSHVSRSSCPPPPPRVRARLPEGYADASPKRQAEEDQIEAELARPAPALPGQEG